MSRLPVRILGVASTTHGFAFVTTESPDRAIDWGKHNFVKVEDAREALNAVVLRAEPLFVACEVSRSEERSMRGRTFVAALKAVCEEYGVMILCIERVKATKSAAEASDQEIAEAMAGHLPVLAHMLPPPRKLWDGVDDRIGVLLAAASASAGWRHFTRRK
jgi:hypothetical protein